MRRTINVIRGASTTSTTYSEAVDLSNYANAAGASRAILRVSFAQHYNDGRITSVILEDSSDNVTYSTLKDFGTLTADNPVLLYTFKPFLRLNYAWTQGTSTQDKGIRLTFSLWSFAPGNWGASVPCRDEHFRGVYSLLTNVLKGFTSTWEDQRAIAKLDLETAIRGHGVDPDSLFLDGHDSLPCVEGLEVAGAWRVAYYALLNAQGPKREDWALDLQKCQVEYEAQLKTFFDSGRATVDLSLDQSPSPGEELRRPVRLVR